MEHFIPPKAMVHSDKTARELFEETGDLILSHAQSAMRRGQSPRRRICGQLPVGVKSHEIVEETHVGGPAGM